jgi:hypothetical protein
LVPLAFDILSKFSSETGGKENIAILVPLALRDPDLAGLQIDVRQPEADEFGIAYPGKEQEFQHHDMCQLVCLPDGGIERDQLGVPGASAEKCTVRGDDRLAYRTFCYENSGLELLPSLNQNELFVLVEWHLL